MLCYKAMVMGGSELVLEFAPNVHQLERERKSKGIASVGIKSKFRFKFYRKAWEKRKENLVKYLWEKSSLWQFFVINYTAVSHPLFSLVSWIELQVNRSLYLDWLEANAGSYASDGS